MEKSIYYEIHRNLPRDRPGRNKYTRKAFHMIPPLKRPAILDIGCGSGDPTLELARLSNGNITALDINQQSLDELQQKATQLNLIHNITLHNCSMTTMDFPTESFDIIWSEGSIYIIGFTRGLQEWKRFIKPKGYLVVHEMCWLQSHPPQEIKHYWEKNYPGITTISRNLQIIADNHYTILGYFPLPKDAWWHDYYKPLQQRIDMLRKKYADSPYVQKQLANEQVEINLFRQYSTWYGSAFFIMQKS